MNLQKRPYLLLAGYLRRGVRQHWSEGLGPFAWYCGSGCLWPLYRVHFFALDSLGEAFSFQTFVCHLWLILQPVGMIPLASMANAWKAFGLKWLVHNVYITSNVNNTVNLWNEFWWDKTAKTSLCQIMCHHMNVHTYCSSAVLLHSIFYFRSCPNTVQGRMHTCYVMYVWRAAVCIKWGQFVHVCSIQYPVRVECLNGQIYTVTTSGRSHFIICLLIFNALTQDERQLPN